MESISEFVRLIAEILTLLGVLLPMTIALVRAIRKSVKEKNWKRLLSLAMRLMEQAESAFEQGADKKSWVMAMLKESLDEINYSISDEELSDLIDNMVDLTNKLNIKK